LDQKGGDIFETGFFFTGNQFKWTVIKTHTYLQVGENNSED